MSRNAISANPEHYILKIFRTPLESLKQVFLAAACLKNVFQDRLPPKQKILDRTLTGQIKNIPQVFGICSTVETVYVDPQEGGIFIFDYGDLLCSSAQLKTVVKNGTCVQKMKSFTQMSVQKL